jgi:predicted ATPase
MISSIAIVNFKCFESLKLPLGKLTLLTGYNGAGKSTATQPLLLLAQGLRVSPNPRAFALNGPLVRLGSVADVVPADGAKAEIRFSLADLAHTSTWILETRAGTRQLAVIAREVQRTEESEQSRPVQPATTRQAANPLDLSPRGN